jgi:azurin
MKTNNLCRTLTLCALALSSSALGSGAEGPKTVVITAGDAMRFDVTEIDAKPGQSIHVVLKNDGTLPKEVMAHNWVLLKAGREATSYSAAAVSSKDQGFEPSSLAGEVIACIPLVGSRQTGETTFAAPMEPGVYQFLCSFPAHCQAGMRGHLVVK